MEARYDLFELPPMGSRSGSVRLLTCPEAKQKMYDLPKPAPGGQYLVRDFYSGTVVAYTVSLKPPTA